MATLLHHSLPTALPLSWAALAILGQGKQVEVIIPRNFISGQSVQVSEEEGVIHSQDQVLEATVRCLGKTGRAVASSSQAEV